MYKRAWCTCKMVVLLIKPIAFLKFSLPSPSWDLKVPISELKQQWRRRLRKRHLKSEVVFPQTLSRLFHLVQFVKCWQIFLELNSKRLYRSSEKEEDSLCLVCVHVLHKTVVFSRRSRTVTAKKCTKRRDARAELLFYQSKFIAFMPLS